MGVAALIVVGLAAVAIGAAALWGALQGVVRLGKFVKRLLFDGEML